MVDKTVLIMVALKDLIMVDQMVDLLAAPLVDLKGC